MRAALFQEIGKPLTVTTVPDPARRAHAVILKVANAGICGSDLHWSSTPGSLAPGMILGHEFSGTIVEAAPAQAALIGQRATALPMFSCWSCRDCGSGYPFSCNHGRLVGLTEPGAFAKYVAVDHRMVQLLPEGVGFDEGALVEPLAVAHQAVAKAGEVRDAAILVVGAGPIGAATALFLRHAGAKLIVVSEPSEVRRRRAVELGATGAIDPFAEDVLTAFRHHGNRRPDIVMVCGGTLGMIMAALDIVEKRGRVIVVGACMEEDRFLPLVALNKNISLVFSGGYEAEDFGSIIDAIDAGAIDVEPMVTDRITLAELPDAFEALRTPTTQCKLLIGMD